MRRTGPCRASVGVRRILEETVKTENGEYKSDFARHYKAEGRVEMILAVLGARGVLIPDEVRVRLVECTDLEQLETWGRRAATADAI